MSSPVQPSLRRRLVFGLILAALFACVGLILLEFILRLAGAGHDPAFVRRVAPEQGPPVLRENRWVTAPYFSQALVRRPQPFRVESRKPADTFRIVLLGSSAAMGDPEPSFSMGRQLEVMLDEAYPELRFEVINAAVTAINSHVVRRIAEGSAALEPDLFIVYEGNNEVIGPFGPGTVFTPFLESPWLVRLVDGLKRTRLGQLVAEAAARLGGTSREWGGMQMFLERQVAHDDPRLERMARLFDRNLHDIAASARRAGAPLLLCTVLTNQRDFAPFLSRHGVAVSAGDRARWRDAVRRGHQELEAGRIPAAEAAYREAWEIDPEHAELAFRRARLALGQGRLDEAQALFQRALDLDTLRFRTDSRLNRLLREFSAEGVTVVDLASAAARASTGGVPGEEFLLEHVHLSFRGNYFVARRLFDAVGGELVRQRRVGQRVDGPLSEGEMRLRLAYTTYEQAMIIRELLNRYRRPPFTAQSDHAARVRALEEKDAAAGRLLNRPGAREALAQLYLEARERRPDDWVLARNHGMAMVALGAPELAMEPLRAALAVIDDEVDALFAYATALEQLGETAAAAEVWSRLRELEPDYPGVPPAARR